MLHTMRPAARSARSARSARCCALLRPAARMPRSRCAPLNPLPRPHPRILRTFIADPPQVLVLRDSAGRPDVLMRCSEPAAEAAPYTAEQLDDVIASEEETTVSGDAPSD